MTSPAARRRSQFIDAAIDDYAAAHCTLPDADQLELQRITQEKTDAPRRPRRRRSCERRESRGDPFHQRRVDTPPILA